VRFRVLTFGDFSKPRDESAIEVAKPQELLYFSFVTSVRGHHLGYCLVSPVSLYLLRVLYPFILCFYCSLLLLSISYGVMPSNLIKDNCDY